MRSSAKRSESQVRVSPGVLFCHLLHRIAVTDDAFFHQVAAGAAGLYVQQLQRIQLFSPLGNQQLAADLEYFCNVLAALSVALPPELVSWAQAKLSPDKQSEEAGVP